MSFETDWGDANAEIRNGVSCWWKIYHEVCPAMKKTSAYASAKGKAYRAFLRCNSQLELGYEAMVLLDYTAPRPSQGSRATSRHAILAPPEPQPFEVPLRATALAICHLSNMYSYLYIMVYRLSQRYELEA